ncbi:Vitamin K epoxide reductase family protein [Posidoniimonas polymericola]|uniref:Vitamin K epoxide reductase family protein n=1 Tax=Posidoniimonas polymericola TaxID=2528002 RepID=A0A5C5YTQ4_9BACT|nr:vitamin K epoxide reductase family protein [Posidoniimonas polymericola]TWT78180.1 Vitamin K epoxide reductase family protein [Posidoniimonas polymericola]
MRQKRVPLAILMSLLALTAAAVSTYLAWKTITAGPVAGCGAASGAACDDILASRWSKWFGLPVSALAAVVYVGIAAAAWPVALRSGAAARGVLTGLIVLAVGAGLWFVGVQVVALGAFCPWCLTVHACSLLIAGTAIGLLRQPDEDDDRQAAASLINATVPGARRSTPRSTAVGPRTGGPLVGAAVAAVCLAALAAGQLLSKAPTPELAEISFDPAGQGAAGQQSDNQPAQEEAAESDDPLLSDPILEDSMLNDGPRELAPIELDANTAEDPNTGLPPLALDGRTLRFKGLAKPVDVDQMPLIGSPDAKHVGVEVVDYACPHCRELHHFISTEIERRDGDLAFVVHHLPLNSDCNPNVDPKIKPSKNLRYSCEFARLAISVWLRKPEEFQAYHYWLMEGEEPPRITKARVRATEIIGDEVLVGAELRGQVAERIRAQCQALTSLSGGLPVMLFQDSAVQGVPKNEQIFTDLLDKTFGP